MNGFSSRALTLVPRTNPIAPSIPRRGLLYQSILEKFAYILDNCSDILTLRKLHASIFTYGISNNPFLGSRVLVSYAKFGFLAESRSLFDQIIDGSLRVWNSILVGYFKAGCYTEILRRYLNLRQEKIGLDGASITFTLKSCLELGNLEFGLAVHLDAYKFGLSHDRFVGSSLIGLYSKYGDILDASKVFDEITDKDVVVYTSMITEYSRMRDHRAYEAFDVFCAMQIAEIDPNRVTLVSLLQVAAQLKALGEGCSVHGYAIRRGIGLSDEVFETSLLDMYIKCSSYKSVDCVFSKMNARTISTWNAVIAGYLQVGQPFEALIYFGLMVKENISPDLHSLTNGIFCCADLKCLFEGKSIHGYIIRNGIRLDRIATTALVDMYSKCCKLVQARKLFDEIDIRDVVSYNVLMAGYLRNEFAIEAVETFVGMLGTDVRPNQASILNLLSALSDLKCTKEGRCVHGYILRHSFDVNLEVPNQIINMYAKCGHTNSAQKVFDQIKYKDLVSYTSMMMGYVSNGNANAAVVLFQMMKMDNIEHDLVTLICLLQAFTHLGCLGLVKEVHCHVYRAFMENENQLINSLVTAYAKCGKINMARDLFEQMKRRYLTSWNTMVAAYGMHGNCLDALKLLEQMKDEKVLPDEITFTSILNACSHSGLIEEGLKVFKSISEDYSMVLCEEHYCCMVDMLSRAGRLEEAYALAKCLPKSVQSSYALRTLLAACRLYGRTELGVIIEEHLLDVVHDDSSIFSSISNFYAADGKWDEVARIRAMTQDRDMMRIPGYSQLMLDKQWND